jgi:hypothetical protein
MKRDERQGDVVALLRELSRDDRVTETVRREAREALKNYERLKGEELEK